MIDVIAIVIAAISLVISVLVAFFQYYQQKTFHKATLNSKYHDEIFLAPLIHNIPKARKYMRFNAETGTLEDTQRFTDELNDMLNEALYYKYKDNSFYKELKRIILDIEDYTMECGNKRFEQEEQGEVYTAIQEKLELLYTLINDQYLGKKY